MRPGESNSTSSYRGLRTGGRSRRVRQAILSAAADELATNGYEDMSFRRIAKAASVATTTVYRRWPERSQLVAAVVGDLTANAITSPDTGSLDGDLRALARTLAASLRDPTVEQLFRAAQAASDPGARKAASEHWAARTQAATEIITRAVDRGEIDLPADPSRVIEAVIAPIWMRTFVTGGVTTIRELDLLVADAVVMLGG